MPSPKSCMHTKDGMWLRPTFRPEDEPRAACGATAYVHYEPRRYNMAKVHVSKKNLVKTTGAFAPPHPDLYQERTLPFLEIMFMAIAGDDLEKFKRLFGKLQESEGENFNLDAYYYGMFVEPVKHSVQFEMQSPRSFQDLRTRCRKQKRKS